MSDGVEPGTFTAVSSRTEYTFCRICEATCGLKATIDGKRVVAVEPDPDHVASKGY
ncbi:MAG: hypothetical protein JSV06_06845 [Myxococcales bacterium]|nr:MAG: hypothetical protein JSV06_06845 [Myxococcales bacterium]